MKKLLTTVGALAALTFTAATASAQDQTAITLVHGIPGTTVDVVVDGDVVVDDFAPGTTADLTTYAGQTLSNVEVLDSSDDSVVIGPIVSLDIPDAGNWSIVAMLDDTNTARLASFENNTSSVDAGNARLTVRHTADAGPVDVIVSGQRPITNLSNGQSQELILPVGTVSGAQLAPTGGDPIVDIGDISLGADTNTVLYVVGSEDTSLTFIQQVVALPAPATTTTVAGTTTTVADGSTTTTTTGDSTTTTTGVSTTTTTTAAIPQAVNTGSPIDDNGTSIALIAIVGGLVVAGGAFLARRRA